MGRTLWRSHSSLPLLAIAIPIPIAIASAIGACGGQAAPSPVVASPADSVNVTPLPVEATSSSAPSAPPPKAPSPVTVLYRGQVPADIAKHNANTVVTTMLFGVEAGRDGAWLRHLVSTPTVKIDEYVRVPLSATKPDAAPMERFSYANDGSAMLRFASVVDARGPIVRNYERATASRTHVFFEYGDHLRLQDRGAKSARPFETGNVVAYKPAVSPDGQTIAFSGCDNGLVKRGMSLPQIQACYALYLSPLSPSKGKPVRIAEVSESSAPVFAPDGRYVYATSIARSKSDASKNDGGCLYRVDAAPPYDRKSIFCSSADDAALTFQVSPDGKTAVVAATRGPVTNQAQRYTWLALPDGKNLGEVEVPYGDAHNTPLSSSGLLVVQSSKGLLVAEPSGQLHTVPGLSRAFVTPTPQWDGDSVYALRTERDGAVEILRIDARAVVASPENMQTGK